MLELGWLVRMWFCALRISTAFWEYSFSYNTNKKPLKLCYKGFAALSFPQLCFCWIIKRFRQNKISSNRPFSPSEGFWVRSIRAGQQTGQLCGRMQAARARWPRSVPAAAPAAIYWSSYREMHVSRMSFHHVIIHLCFFPHILSIVWLCMLNVQSHKSKNCSR